MMILGLDIGYDRCGICIWKDENIIFSGLIITDKKLPIQKRLEILRQDLVEIKQKYNPEYVGVEKLFLNRKNSTFEKICMSKGIAFEVFCNSEIYEITPKTIKKEVAGSGDASKEDIANVLTSMLKMDLSNYMDDVIDAMAIAIYLEQKLKLEKLYNKKR